MILLGKPIYKIGMCRLLVHIDSFSKLSNGNSAFQLKIMFYLSYKNI